MPDELRFHADVYLGKELEEQVETVADCTETRSQLESLERFWHELPRDKVCILYGLRRTGKTTLMLQLADALRCSDAEQKTDEFARTAYVVCVPGMTCQDIRDDFRLLRKMQIKTVLLDEASLSSDFIKGAAFLADGFARMKMRIILAGTDSLKFMQASKHSLYDRCELIHTTHIPYREWSRIMKRHGPDSVDLYADYGGTFVLSGEKGRMRFEPEEIQEIKLRDYLDESVAENIGHVLDEYDGFDRAYLSLKQVRNAGDLQDLIYRSIQNDSHKFLLETINVKFNFLDYKNAKGKLNKIYNLNGSNARDGGDIRLIDEVLFDIKNKLNIKDAEKRTIQPSIEHYETARRLLIDLDLLIPKEISLYHDSTGQWETDLSGNILAMPGMRRCMAKMIVEGLTDEQKFSHIPPRLREEVVSIIMDQVHGHLLEDVVASEIVNVIKKPQFSLFSRLKITQLRFAETNKNKSPSEDWTNIGCFSDEKLSGEIDIAIAWRRPIPSCVLFEVKHSKHIDLNEHAKHLLDSNKIEAIKKQFGDPIGKIVLNNASTSLNHCNSGIDYINVAEFLESLPDSLEAVMMQERERLKKVLDKTQARQERKNLEKQKHQNVINNKPGHRIGKTDNVENNFLPGHIDLNALAAKKLSMQSNENNSAEEEKCRTKLQT